MVVCVWFTISICLSWTKRLSRLSLAPMLSWLKRKSPEEQAAEKNKVFEIELQSTVLNKKKKQKLKLALSTSTNAPNMINVTSSSPPQREARFAPTKHDGRKRTPAPCRIAGRTRIPDFQKSLDARALQRLANSSSTGGIVVHKRRHFTNSEKRIICNFAAAFKSQKKALNFLQHKNQFIQLGQLSTWMKQHCQGVFNPVMTVPRTTGRCVVVAIYICILSSETYFYWSSLCSETCFHRSSLSTGIFGSENANERTTKVLPRPSYL